LNQHYVFDNHGNRALLESIDEKQAWLRLDEGRLISLPSPPLAAQDDGSYRVAYDLTRFQVTDEMVIPVTQEEVHVDKREIEQIVRISKTVRTEDVVVDEPLHREDIDVEHVMINRYVDEPLSVRHEGDVTIIPLVEEVLVVEKRLLLREEIRVARRKTTVNNPQVYTLRREDVQIERDDEAKS